MIPGLFVFLVGFYILLVLTARLIRNGHFELSRVKQRTNVVFPKISLTRDSNVFHHFFPGAGKLAKVYQQVSFGLDRKDLVINLITVLVTILVTSDQVVVHVFQHNTKISTGGMEFRV